MRTALFCRVFELAGFFLLIGFAVFLHLRPRLHKRRLLQVICLCLSLLYLTGISVFRSQNLDLAQGEVTDFRLPEGQYTGLVKDGLPEGKGTLTLKDKSVIRASFKDGEAAGPGSITYPDGSAYNGELKHNRMDGVGCLVRTGKATTIYTGMFKSGVLAGTGTISYADDSFYEGEIVNLQPNGKGKLVFADGSTYAGEFVSGLFHGQGTFTCKSCGHVYEGSFVCGMMQGNGTLTMKDGKQFTGVWQRDRFNRRLFWCSAPYYHNNYILSMGRPFVEERPNFLEEE